MNDYTAAIIDSLAAIKAEIVTFSLRLDYIRAVHWVGIAIGRGYSVPIEIQKILINAHYYEPDHKALMKALDAWKI